MKRFCLVLTVLFCLVIFNGCKTVDQYMSPQQQCMFVRSGTSTGIAIAMENLKKKDGLEAQKHSNAIVKIVEGQIIPILKQKKMSSLNCKEWNQLLSLVDKKLTKAESLVIQNSILTILSFVDMPDSETKSLGGRAIQLLICMFSGVLDAFTMYSTKKGKQSSIMENVKRICGECNKK